MLSSFIISILTATVTEFTSNTATANVLVPIIVDTSKKLCINPIYLAMPAMLSCSYAFMLPAATAPNAIVKAAGNIDVWQMMKVGFVLNLITVAVTVVMTNTYGTLLFEFGQELPEWLVVKNDTGFDICNGVVGGI